MQRRSAKIWVPQGLRSQSATKRPRQPTRIKPGSPRSGPADRALDSKPSRDQTLRGGEQQFGLPRRLPLAAGPPASKPPPSARPASSTRLGALSERSGGYGSLACTKAALCSAALPPRSHHCLCEPHIRQKSQKGVLWPAGAPMPPHNCPPPSIHPQGTKYGLWEQ